MTITMVCPHCGGIGRLPAILPLHDHEGVRLTETQGVIMAALIAQRGKLVRRQTIVATLEAYDHREMDEKCIDVHVSNLRRKFAGIETIATVHGLGFMLEARP